ncbi:hypothetical protein [Mycobacterium celatum]|uniref:Uncharacterized protein n=1 Tax=Mycobacterium celatum TaxID=28045 RepID=A0A1X1RML8_MYCCE|nr:hypothetical protein [Mycobacterium celatum]ORV09652.1 hypothetical protein AWB95_17705 [Mycobacterium celatum]PIB75659.1 hypothetical protein CQY23_19555 [Mycobacterium celatum]
MTTTTNAFHPIPLPTGIVFVDNWQPVNPQPYRVVMGADPSIDRRDVKVRTSAIQFADGRIDDAHIEPQAIHVDDCDWPLTAAQARELAAVLIAAADQVDAMSEPTGTVDA